MSQYNVAATIGASRVLGINICRKPELNVKWQVQRTGIFPNKLRCAAPWGCGISPISTNIKSALHQER